MAEKSDVNIMQKQIHLNDNELYKLIPSTMLRVRIN